MAQYRDPQPAEEIVPVPIAEEDFRRDGNVFAIGGQVGRAMRRNGQGHRVEEMHRRVSAQRSYEDALVVLMEYVEFTYPEDEDDEDEG